MVLSNHHLATLTLRFPQRASSSKLWRLDVSLPTGLADVATFKQVISEYFCHDTPDVSPMTQWEAQKCVVRGHLLSIAARRKREHKALIQSLAGKISRLEAQHKCSLAIGVVTELVDTRALLSEALYKRAWKRFMLSQKLFFTSKGTSQEEY